MRWRRPINAAFGLLLLFTVLTACRGNGLRCHVVREGEGYGYVILRSDDTLIVQPYMPAMGGRRPFTTRRHARAVGELVCRKLQEGRSPMVSRGEVEALR